MARNLFAEYKGNVIRMQVHMMFKKKYFYIEEKPGWLHWTDAPYIVLRTLLAGENVDLRVWLIFVIIRSIKIWD